MIPDFLKSVKILLHFQTASKTKKSVFSVFGNTGILCQNIFEVPASRGNADNCVISKKLLFLLQHSVKKSPYWRSTLNTAGLLFYKVACSRYHVCCAWWHQMIHHVESWALSPCFVKAAMHFYLKWSKAGMDNFNFLHFNCLQSYLLFPFICLHSNSVLLFSVGCQVILEHVECHTLCVACIAQIFLVFWMMLKMLL
jgi:hypothetical protein